MRPALGLAVVSGVVLVAAGCGGTSPASNARPSERPAASNAASPATATAGARPTHTVVRRAAWRLPAPLAREAAVLLPDGAHAVVAGGLLPGDASSTATYRVDLRTGRVDHRAALPVAVHDTAGVLLAGRPLVLGGGNASEQAVVQSVSAGGRPHVVGRLPAARSDLVAAVEGGRACVLGGYDGGAPALGAVLCSTDGRHWRRIGALPVPVRYAALAVQGHLAWIVGGERSGAMVDDVQRVDLRTGSARVVGHLPRPIGHAAAVVVGRRVLVAGGRTSADTVTDRSWWWNLDSHRTRPGPRLPWPLADSAVVRAQDTAYLLGGETPAETGRVVEIRQVPLSGR
ncbi:MAG: hypothetical protein ACTHNS_13080 [Marmoricola sp.]